ncbi:MAG TPA: hydrogenase/urease maturation nickel metallochaperone HypA [Mycobacteriales bacterium]|nr:hydrogenase/urease maturation nickel metallochaperone HypA [Mycobacteriales bacterium]
MHEVGICEDVLDAVLQRADGRTVRNVKLRVGIAHHMTGELFDRTFPLVAAGTVAADAHLDVDIVDGDDLLLESITVAREQ